MKVSQEEVMKAIRSARAGAAPGPSGLRYEHLKEAISTMCPGSGQRALSAITGFLNLLSQGKVPAQVKPYFFGARLFATIKKVDDFRPVAVGNVLRRLASKCFAFKSVPEMSAYLRPLQFGIGVKSGCEGIIHAIRAILEDDDVPDEEKWVLQVDLENCHNNLD